MPTPRRSRGPRRTFWVRSCRSGPTFRMPARPGLTAAVDRFAARMDALGEAGIDPARLPFEASYGRTTMEYYDGFVFGFLAPLRPDLPPVASGGRYDALTAILGAEPIPAVGGVIRPELVRDLRAGGTP